MTLFRLYSYAHFYYVQFAPRIAQKHPRPRSRVFRLGVRSQPMTGSGLKGHHDAQTSNDFACGSLSRSMSSSIAVFLLLMSCLFVLIRLIRYPASKKLELKRNRNKLKTLQTSYSPYLPDWGMLRSPVDTSSRSFQ
jgi:hypothetical protein